MDAVYLGGFYPIPTGGYRPLPVLPQRDYHKEWAYLVGTYKTPRECWLTRISKELLKQYSRDDGRHVIVVAFMWEGVPEVCQLTVRTMLSMTRIMAIIPLLTGEEASKYIETLKSFGESIQNATGQLETLQKLGTCIALKALGFEPKESP